MRRYNFFSYTSWFYYRVMRNSIITWGITYSTVMWIWYLVFFFWKSYIHDYTSLSVCLSLSLSLSLSVSLSLFLEISILQFSYFYESFLSFSVSLFFQLILPSISFFLSSVLTEQYNKLLTFQHWTKVMIIC